MIVEFGKELSGFGYVGYYKVDPEIKVSEVNRAVDCWLIDKTPVRFNFDNTIDGEKLNRVLHPVFDKRPMEWILDLEVNHREGVRWVCESLRSYLEFRLAQKIVD